MAARLPTAGTKDREKAARKASEGLMFFRELGHSGRAKIPNNVNELESLR